MRKFIWLLILVVSTSLFGAKYAVMDWEMFLNVLPDARAYMEVSTLCDAYGDYFDKVEIRRGDVAFLVNQTWIYYQNGRLVSEKNLGNSHRYDSLFTEYDQKGPVDKLPRQRRLPRSRDLLRAMFGRTDGQVRKHCVTMTFLNHEVNVNRICAQALREIEREIYAAAAYDEDVRRFVEELSVIYSFHRKNVKGSRTLSFHAYGLALDLIPGSYDEKHVNWQWSRYYKRRWYSIPEEQRWRPPQAVMDAFLSHGFIWGGDWIRFDGVHFEFRPEIAYTRSPQTFDFWYGGLAARVGLK
jgi:hypothetical protein